MQSHTIHLSIAPGDYGALTGFPLGPFNNSVRQLSFTVTIENDTIPENDETFIANLTLSSADQDSPVTVAPDTATVTILDDEGKSKTYALYFCEHITCTIACKMHGNVLLL